VFGFSLQKLLVLIAIIGGIYAFFRFVTKMKKQQDELRRARAQMMQKQAYEARARGGAEPAGMIQDLKNCGRCGAYVAAEGGGCGRKDCPFRAGA